MSCTNCLAFAVLNRQFTQIMEEKYSHVYLYNTQYVLKIKHKPGRAGDSLLIWVAWSMTGQYFKGAYARFLVYISLCSHQ